MSFASSLGRPVSSAAGSARALLRGGNLKSMAQAIGVVAGAGLLAAGYQIAYEEGRQVIHNVRTSSAQRRARNDTVILALFDTDLPAPALDSVRRSRNALDAAMALATDPATPEEHRTAIRTALRRLIRADSAD